MVKLPVLCNEIVETYYQLSDEAFVHRLYQDLLGRQGDLIGIHNYLERLRNGKASRQEIVKDFLRSKEYRIQHRSSFKRTLSRLKNRCSMNTIWAGTTARLAYRLILNRPIDPAALTRWKTVLRESRQHRINLINSLFLSEEYNNLVTRNPFSDVIMLNYLHRERCKLVRSLPKGKLIVDLGGSSPNNPIGALLSMGYPHRFETLLIVDLPMNQSFEQRMAKETYDVVQTEQGKVRYVYKDMCDIRNTGIQENSVDLFWMGQSVEHIEEGRFDDLLALIRRYLKPGGYYCFDTPNRKITSLQSPDHLIHPDHKIEYFFEPLAEKIKRAGFEIVEALGIGLADEALRQNRFLPAYLIENAGINSDPEHSYIFYMKNQKSL